MTTDASRKWAVLFAVTATQFAVPFMISAVGVILPAIGLEFQANGVALSLIESVFLGVNAMCLLIFGRASDLMGRQWMFLSGLVLFTLGTALLGFAPSVHAIIAIRVIQGVGGAMMVSTGLAILLEVFRPEERGKVLGIALASVYLGVSAGPFAGGYIAGLFGWRWLFFIGCAPCLLALVLALRAMRWDFHRSEVPFDRVGSVLSVLCIGLLLVAGAGIDEPYGLPALGAACLALILFIFVELRSEHPLLDLTMFSGNAAFSAGNMLQFINYSATFGLTFLMSLYLQLGHGMTPAEAGRILFLQPLIQSVLSPVCGRLADRHSADALVTAGIVLVISGLVWASTFDAQTSLPAILSVLVLLGLGIALFVSPNMKLIMSSVPRKQYGIATAVTGQMRILGMTASMVAISMVISVMVGDKVLDAAAFPHFNEAMQVVLRGFSIVAVLGLLVSLVVSYRNKGRLSEAK